MKQSAETKLSELRCKTNRQLAVLISHRLDRGLAFARVAEEDGLSWASIEMVNAEQTFTEAKALMALLNSAPLEQRRLEFKLAQLGAALDRVRESHLRAQAAC
jgi:hypothetical protein